MNKSLVILIVLVALVLVAPILAPHPVEASGRECPAPPAPGGGYVGALNMVHDATMDTVPMARDAPQGNAGMYTAVYNSGTCPPP